MVQKNERNGCSSCLLKLSLMQAQIENVEKMLYCIKDTLNFKEACLYTGLSNSQLYKLAKNGNIPHYKPSGKLLFFSRRELDGWLCRNQGDSPLENMEQNEYELKEMKL